MCFCQLHPRFVADATEKMKEATYVCSPQLYIYKFLQCFQVQVLFPPPQVPVPALPAYEYLLGAVRPVLWSWRPGWTDGSMRWYKLPARFSLTRVYRHFWENCLDFPCLNCDLYLWFLCPGIPFWLYRIQYSIFSWSITPYINLIYWPKNVGTLSYIIWIVYARLGVLGRNAKKYEKKDDGSQPGPSDKSAPKEQKRRKRPAEKEAEEPEPKKSKGNKVKKSKAS